MSLSEERLELQKQQLEIERLRVELEKQRIEAELKQSSKKTFAGSLRLAPVLAAVGSLLAIAIPGSQVVTTYLNNQRELQVNQSQNEVEEIVSGVVDSWSLRPILDLNFYQLMTINGERREQ